ncbi:MAG TPA: gamma-glutamyltransferase [Ignavibacteriaceae bacterium]|nr:gamma-glutamyltransferase [Ignavibacteriaceae bacterium]
MPTFFRSYTTLLFIFLTSFINSQVPGPMAGKNGMVVSASELASQIGIDILKKGGNAVDASVAVGFALAVTYPAAGNIGGGGFMVLRLNDGTTTSIDYREKAPSSAHPDIYLDDSGNPLPEKSAAGVTSAGVPGSVAGLIYALEKYGSMSLEEVIQPAIDLALNGFELEYRLAGSFKSTLESFKKYESSFKIFSKNDEPFEAGDLFIQKDLGRTLGIIKQKGRDGFYKGEIAELIVKHMTELDGWITLDDLANYEPVEREPVFGTYRGYEIISMGPPSAGGILLVQVLNILENLTFERKDWGSSSYIHNLTEALKYAYADRSKHIGDPDFHEVPKDKLISKDYAYEIFNRISDKAVPSELITPVEISSLNESEETTHYSVIDKFGNAVSTTTTINSGFGSKIIVDGAGFLLNNEMDDFSIQPGIPNQFGLTGGEANKVEPNKRMVSSMTPTIILKGGKPFLIVGSPGGSTIMTVVLQVALNVLDFNMNIQRANDVFRIHHQWLPDRIDYEPFGLSEDVKNNLIDRGHNIGNERTLGRMDAIFVDQQNGVYYGATDKRGYGAAIGY